MAEQENQAQAALPGAVTVADMYLERLTKRTEEMSANLARLSGFIERVGLALENQANAPVATLAAESVELEWGEIDPITERLDKIIALLQRNQVTLPAGETELKEKAGGARTKRS